ncbi:uncharacterized protein [Halyomorpha halys]|uniref:uncharacterized protein n=1 Tax=Halyomorpha halys TaxID=286706 RepID=UPI0006D4DC72|nr:uncharacterized protein LOC106678583 [Halyomorpha halys]
MVLMACCFEFCCMRESPPPPAPRKIKEVCDDDNDDDIDFESEGTEIICTSSSNDNEWSEDDLSQFRLTSSSAPSLMPDDRNSSRRVTWGNNNSRWMEKSSWRMNPSQNVEVLYPAKSCLKRPSSTGIDSRSSSKGSASTSTDRQKMFETHFRLLISLLLRRQPCTEAREHLDWIFQNCPNYQRRLVIRFMSSFGMDVDRNGHMRGFHTRANTFRSSNDGQRRHKRRSCHLRLRPKKFRRVYQCREEKGWYKEKSSQSLLQPSVGCRGEPEGLSDIDRNMTISPDYGDILKSVLPKCLGASSSSDSFVDQAQLQKDPDPETAEEDQLPECSPPSTTASQLDISSKELTAIIKKGSAMLHLALRHKNPFVTSASPAYSKYLKNIEKMRRNYSEFIEEIPRPLFCSSIYESSLCTRRTAMDQIHFRITEHVMQKLLSLEGRYRGILSNKIQWEIRGFVTRNISGIVQKRSSGHILLDEEKTFMKFFKNLIHFLFLMSCKRETMQKIMTTFGCSKHRTEMKLHPHACLFLCYLQPILLKFWKIVEVERLLLEYFVVEYPQHTCLSFITNLKKTTKFRICLYLHMYKILAMATRMEGIMEPNRRKFLLHIRILERDLARFFKDMEKFQDPQRGVKPSYILAGSLLSILEVLHYFMVQSLYKMCLIHVGKPDT